MKRLISLLLIFTFIFTFALTAVSCSDSKECEEHTDGNGNGICDVCDTKFKNSEVNVSAAVGAIIDRLLPGSVITDKKSALADIIVRQIELASSSRLNLLVSIKEEKTDLLPFKETLVALDLTLSKENGVPSALIYAQIKSRDSEDGEYETDFGGYLAALVDGTLYGRYIDKEIYFEKKLDMPTSDELSSVIGELLYGIAAPTAEDKAALKAELTELFEAAFEKKDGKAYLTANPTEPLKEFLAYNSALDLEDGTVGDLIDDCFGFTDTEITASDILPVIRELLPLTVNEACERLDTILTENHGITLEEAYEDAARNDSFISLVENLLSSVGESEEKINELTAKMRFFTLDGLIEEYGVGDSKVISLISEYLPTEEGKSAEEAAEAILTRYEELLSTPLLDFLSLSCGMSKEEIKAYKAILDTVDAESAALDLTVSFSDGYNVSDVEARVSLEFAAEIPSSDGEAPRRDYTVTAYARLYELSASAVEITVPDSLKTRR